MSGEQGIGPNGSFIYTDWNETRRERPWLLPSVSTPAPSCSGAVELESVLGTMLIRGRIANFGTSRAFVCGI